MPTKFNYEKKVWGGNQIEISPSYIQALKLKYALTALESTKGKVLDVGCGGGNMAKAIKNHRSDLTVFGSDIAKKALEVANKEPSGVKFVLGSADRLPFKDSFFDAVVMFDVLEHMKEPSKTLAEINRVLCVGGVFHIFCPLEGDLKNFYGWLWKLGWKAKKIHCGHIQQFSNHSLEAIIEKSGFVIQDKKWSFHPLFSLFDIAYFSGLYIRGKTPMFSVEGALEQMKPSMLRSGLGLLKSSVVSIGYFESSLLKKFPGGGVHLTAIKNG